jgi:integration host factor subunit alpha
MDRHIKHHNKRRESALTKKEIIENVSDRIGLKKKESADIVESLFEVIKDELAKGKPVMISGFGKWTVKSKHSRRGRNPQTGEPITIDARKVVSFKPSAVLRTVFE